MCLCCETATCKSGMKDPSSKYLGLCLRENNCTFTGITVMQTYHSHYKELLLSGVLILSLKDEQTRVVGPLQILPANVHWTGKLTIGT